MTYSVKTEKFARRVALEWAKIAAKEANPKVKEINVGPRIDAERKLVLSVMRDLKLIDW